MPLIRYELGDMAEAGAVNPSCGRGLPTVRRILGRYRNLFRFRDGTTVWPTPAHFRNFIAGKQFQVVQTDFDHIEIRYVPEIVRSADRPSSPNPTRSEHAETARRCDGPCSRRDPSFSKWQVRRFRQSGPAK